MDISAELGYSNFVQEGVYCMVSGPNFETIAEARMLQILGSDSVGEGRHNIGKYLSQVLSQNVFISACLLPMANYLSIS